MLGPLLAKRTNRTYATGNALPLREQKPDSLATIGSRGTPKLPAGKDRNDAKAWAPLLEACLPPQLRLLEYQSLNAGIQDGAEKGRILYVALRRPASGGGVDLLYDLGIKQGRWQAVVWLVKSLVDALGAKSPSQDETSPVTTIWNGQISLDELTQKSIELDTSLSGPKWMPPHALDTLDAGFDHSTKVTAPEDRGELRRNVLGVIWRSLGAMIIACADGPVKPEILEIIAYLHHSGIMPASIYSRKPRLDETAIQQPPTLHMLSSRILTSLSDAAWRAHEKIVLDQAKANGNKSLPLRPEIPGSAYRIHVSGLSAEIWLELILWSCLHGEWVQEGLAILETVYRQPQPQWKAISWRSLLPDANDSLRNWDKLEYIFNTQAPHNMDQDPVVHDVKRTISSEVVNAYVDALVSELDAAKDSRVVLTVSATQQLNAARAFLDRSGLKLGGGSWDAVVLRLFESRADDILGIHAFQQILGLSPGFGVEVNSKNTQRLPPYVRDGSAAAIGIGHQVLRTKIKAGDLAGAFHVIFILQRYTDENKKRSLQDFFRFEGEGKQQRRIKGSPLFTGNYSMIDYPAFGLQIPSTTLGQLLELATADNSLEYGRWLLYNDEVDGPLIPEHMYKDPAVAPALIRFATAAQDNALLAKVVQAKVSQNRETGSGPTLSHSVLQSFFDVQVRMRRWPAAHRILETLSENMRESWSAINLAHVARAIIELQYQSDTPEDNPRKEDLVAARQLFHSMFMPEREEMRIQGSRDVEKVQTLCTILATVDEGWADFTATIAPLPDHFVFKSDVKAFNIVLQSIADTRGATAAHQLVDTFWPASVRNAHKRHISSRSARRRSNSLDHPHRQRTVLRIPTAKEKLVAVYGGLRPNSATLRIVMRSALNELERIADEAGLAADVEWTSSVPPDDSKESTMTQPIEIVIWAHRALLELGSEQQDLLHELQKTLPNQQLERLRTHRPALFESVDHEADDDATASAV
ncbi:hypothetical protein LTR86_009370 [Recurvomyces mirabilis]|nr:hypothetical protein LTR86_009370 [Recurvomyces mirabilis]